MIICGQAVGELALHFIEKYGMMVMKCPSKVRFRARVRVWPRVRAKVRRPRVRARPGATAPRRGRPTFPSLTRARARAPTLTAAQAYSNSEEESLEAIIKAIADAGTKFYPYP